MPGHGRALRKRHLRLERQGAEAHPRDVHRDVELDRLLGEPGTENRLRDALLAIALDHEARQRARHEHQLVPVRDRLEHREAAHAVAAELGLHVDVVHHLGGEDPALPEDGLVVGCCLVGHCGCLSVARAGRVPPLQMGQRLSRSGRACPTRRRVAVIRAPASARMARGCRSCRASCRRRTSAAPVGRRGRRCGTSAR